MNSLPGRAFQPGYPSADPADSWKMPVCSDAFDWSQNRCRMWVIVPLNKSSSRYDGGALHVWTMTRLDNSPSSEPANRVVAFHAVVRVKNHNNQQNAIQFAPSLACSRLGSRLRDYVNCGHGSRVDDLLRDTLNRWWVGGRWWWVGGTSVLSGARQDTMCGCDILKLTLWRHVLRLDNTTVIVAGYDNPGFDGPCDGPQGELQGHAVILQPVLRLKPVGPWLGPRTKLFGLLQIWIRWRGRRVGPLFTFDDSFDYDKRWVILMVKGSDEVRQI